MSAVVNLKRARKRVVAADKKSLADRNAALHGLTKAQKTATKSIVDAQARNLDGHKRDD